ncbi:hypothetical protein [Brevibacillus laterosporus]|uniref:hypothetical protein n=1 Tax=Brevibacillus laterosporus TaxID=1465 RepID=UPI0003B19B39|nr:hypothetical protein [Brevibacillus laterosporus]AYK05305.1 hypothetical protein D8Z77_02110 [Brevibacillus laterosporus]ERM19024.1 hypothetical protein P615_14130 [Brevibacillus laterosporus PE36]
METLPSRKKKWKNESRKRIGKLIIFSCIFFIVLTYGILVTLNQLQVKQEQLNLLMQSLGSMVLAVAISFPAILVGVFQIKYPELNKQGKEVIQSDFISFVILYGLYILGNSILYLCQYLSFFKITNAISIMLGTLIGITLVFLKLIIKMLSTLSIYKEE